MLLNKVIDLTNRVRNNLQKIQGELYLDVYLFNEFFELVAENWRQLKSAEIAPKYFELQKIMLDILLNIEVNGQRGSLYNSMMTYNATCTEENLHYFYGIPYGGNGELEHLCIHTGRGNNTSDLDAKAIIQLPILTKNGPAIISAGTKFEVKDYKDFKSAREHFVQEAGTTVYHDANNVFIHLIDTTDYFIADNRKDAAWFLLANTQLIKRYRRQVILWMQDDGFLGVKFR
jgi:hypothetical protein